jgi:hypothetical protein
MPTSLTTSGDSKTPAWEEAFGIIAGLLPLLLTDQAEACGDFESCDLEALCHYRLSPLVFREMARKGLHRSLDPVAQEILRHDYVAATLAACKQEKQISELLQALQQAGLSPILLKGADIRQRLYGEASLRPMSDIDFLIAPADLKCAQGVLDNLGYRLSTSQIHPSTDYIETRGFELLYSPPDSNPLEVEPHWEIRAAACQYCLPYSVLSGDAREVTCYGAAVRILSPEHLLIHLCIHLYGDFGRFDYGDSGRVSPIHVIDIILALDRLTVNWERLTDQAVKLGCAYPVHLILASIAPLVPSLVPEHVLGALRRHRPPLRQRALLRLRDALRQLSRHFPWLRRHYRLWEIVTFYLAGRRSRP